MQVAPFCHVPLASQVCVVWPLHCFEVGLHVPEHAPPLQTFVQRVPFCQVPVLSHVWGVRPLHVFVPGLQLPEQTPATHAWFVQTVGALH